MTPIVLPWPQAALSPNARVHHMARARAAAKAREQAALLARAARIVLPDEGAIAVRIEACPPKGWRTGDLDNMLARLKPVLDGLADGLGVNDRRFRPALSFGDRCQHGAVHITVEAA